MSCVPSVDPLSTTNTLRVQPLSAARHRGRLADSLNAMIMTSIIESFRRDAGTADYRGAEAIPEALSIGPLMQEGSSPKSLGPSLRGPIGLAGVPAATTHAGRSLNTPDRAPTTVPSPMVTPGPTKTSAATQLRRPITIGLAISGWRTWL